jgi:hypothetical protein
MNYDPERVPVPEKLSHSKTPPDRQAAFGVMRFGGASAHARRAKTQDFA